MPNPSVNQRGAVAMIVGVLLASICQQAFAVEPDPVLLRIKGYSPELVRFAEWKEPVPQSLTPGQRIIKNIIYNNWLGSMDEFGYEVIRDF